MFYPRLPKIMFLMEIVLELKKNFNKILDRTNHPVFFIAIDIKFFMNKMNYHSLLLTDKNKYEYKTIKRSYFNRVN